MKLESLNRLYTRELDAFHAAVAGLQTELARLARSAGATTGQAELLSYLEQMADLGLRLERLFSLVNEKYWGSQRLNTDELRVEIQSLMECSSAGASPDNRAGPNAVSANR